MKATDDLGRTSTVSRGFWVNDTVGFLRVSPRVARLGRHRRNLVTARFRLVHPAKVIGSVWTKSGFLVRRLGPVRFRPGQRMLRWNGRYKQGGLAYRGRYVFKVYAQNAYGPITVAQTFGVRR